MAGLAQRLWPETEAEHDTKLDEHAFCKAFHGLHYGDTDRDGIVRMFGLNAREAAGVDELLATKAAQIDPIGFAERLEALTALQRRNLVDRAHCQARLGITSR